MSENLLVRFDEGRVGRTFVSPSLLLYSLWVLEVKFKKPPPRREGSKPRRRTRHPAWQRFWE